MPVFPWITCNTWPNTSCDDQWKKHHEAFQTAKERNQKEVPNDPSDNETDIDEDWKAIKDPEHGYR